MVSCGRPFGAYDLVLQIVLCWNTSKWRREYKLLFVKKHVYFLIISVNKSKTTIETCMLVGVQFFGNLVYTGGGRWRCS